MTAWALLAALLALAGCTTYSADTLVCMGFCAYREHETLPKECPQYCKKEDQHGPDSPL